MKVKSFLLGGILCSSTALITGRHYDCVVSNSYTISRAVQIRSEINTSTGGFTVFVIESLKKKGFFSLIT